MSIVSPDKPFGIVGGLKEPRLFLGSVDLGSGGAAWQRDKGQTSL